MSIQEIANALGCYVKNLAVEDATAQVDFIDVPIDIIDTVLSVWVKAKADAMEQQWHGPRITRTSDPESAPPWELQERRKNCAEAAFREYKFPVPIEYTGEWDITHNEWTRDIITCEYVCGFLVRFKPGSDIVATAYGTSFPPGTRPANLLMFANMTEGEIHGNSVLVKGGDYGYVRNFMVSDTTAQVEFREIPHDLMRNLLEKCLAAVKADERRVGRAPAEPAKADETAIRVTRTLS